ncbi:MAG: hypothetical protein DMG39_08610 [Acidobacteria bacterium]|nr:MAG: hypothetical protein DMG39_08610 [Acidobacteriota bacterium]
MAIEQLQFAPVITPRTLEELARILHEDGRPELARVVSDLIPVAQEVVENFFKPISQVLQPLDGVTFLKFYGEMLLHLNEGLLHSADAKHIPAHRIKKVVEGYFAAFAKLVKFVINVERVQLPGNMEELNLADWVRSSTDLDYGLTSLFLILEEAISTPSMPIPELLVVAAEDSLNRFVDQCEILTRKASFEGPTGDPTKRSSLRSRELQWLKERTSALQEFAGKWIVVEGNELIANDSSYESARDKANRAGIVRPFIVFVPESNETAFMGI